MLLSLQSAVELGIIYAIMALGVFISFRTLNIPDLTVDGSFTLGASVSAVLCMNGQPVLGILIAFIIGCFAGSLTALLNTKLKIQPLLAGILMMLALWSINLRVMGGKANVSLLNKNTIYSIFDFSDASDYLKMAISAVILIVILILLYLFLKTKLGIVLRATGDNDQMVRALGVNTNWTVIIGLALSNGLVAVSGALIAQNQGFSDVSMGIGMVVIGLASVIIGEVIFGIKTLMRRLIAVILGAIVYRMVIAAALELGMPTNDMKLISAVIVALALSMSTIKGRFVKLKRRMSVTNTGEGGRD
jgi:putative ABC transport system permease protein